MDLQFHSGSTAYPIHIGQGILSHAGGVFALDRKVLIITDNGVPPQYAQAVLSCCPQGSIFTIEEGESHKSLACVEGILNDLLSKGFTRSDAIVAVGGGMVGDVAGFAAACYQRGIDWYNVPTTLLSQADSCVGGKTGVNLGGVKNAVGAFHQPKGVLVDTDTLATLSPRLLSEGMAEVIKMAATSDADLFRMIENGGYSLPELVSRAILIKVDVVLRDPKEKGERAVLNFGHTVGHAIEAAGKGEFYHGEAVAAGMMYFSTGEAKTRIEALLRRYNLPVSDPFPADTLMRFASSDKKKSAGGFKTVWVDRIGSYSFRQLSEDDLRSVIENHKQQ